MSEKSTPSSSPSNNSHSVQKKKSFRNRKKSNSNLKVKPLEHLENGKKENTDKIPKNQLNKENNDNKKPEIEKKEVDKKKNRYHKKKSMNNMKKDESKTEIDSRSDISSSTNGKKDLKKSSSKQHLNQKKKRKSKMNLKAEKTEKIEEHKSQPEEDNSDDELITHLTYLSMKRVEMEKEEEEQHLNNPPPQASAHKYPKKQGYKPYNKANKRKKELPTYNDEMIRRVLDCYDFPEEYLTSTFFEIFKDFKDNFQINWINEHRALLIFDSDENATKAYLQKRNESEFNIKPYENPIKEYSEDESEEEGQDQECEQEQNHISKQNKKYVKKEVNNLPSETRKTLQKNSKSSNISNETQEKPVRRQRPVTSDAVARRLIANALGVKPKEKTEEEKEIDRKKFEEARAKKLAERLERQKRLQENSDIFNE